MTAARMVIVVEQLAAFKCPLVVARGLLVVVSARVENVELSEIKVKADECEEYGYLSKHVC